MSSLFLWITANNQAHARVGSSSPIPRSLAFMDPCYPMAKFVKIETADFNTLSLFEVQTLSVNDVNVALNKPTTQSSTLFSPSLAVDGDVTTYSSTTTDDFAAWWQVDLDGSYQLKSVNIKNFYCTDSSDPEGCLCRLSGATVSVLNEVGDVVSTKVLGDTCGVHDIDVNLSTCIESATTSTSIPFITFSDAVIVEDESFEITFNNPLSDTTIFAAVVSQSECTEENSSSPVNALPIGTVGFSGTSSATVFQNLNELITAEEKNLGSAYVTFCLRSDVFSPEFPSSLVASKVSLGITVTYQEESVIALDVETLAFSDTTIDYTSYRGVDISATLGECASPSNDGPYGIGSSLKFCVRSNDADVVISGLKEVSFTDTAGNPILGIVDSTGAPSFVTAVTGLDSKSVDISTMMITTIFDQGFGGTTITVQGTVSLDYLDFVPNARRRNLQGQEKEDQPFSLQLKLEDITSQDDYAKQATVNKAVGGVVAALSILGLVLYASLA